MTLYLIKNIKNTIEILLIFLSLNSFSQNGFVGENHSFQIDGDSLILFLEAEFALGSFTCDFLDTCYISIENDTVVIDAIYDISGFYPAFWCVSRDTLDYNVTNQNYNTIVINSSVITIDSTDSCDTLVVYSQLFSNVSSKIERELIDHPLTMYPNPSNGLLHIEVPNGVVIERIEWYDVLGKKVKTHNGNHTPLNIADIPEGTYLIKFHTNEGITTKRLIREKL